MGAIARRLEGEHGPFRRARRLTPVDQLVATILSQATSDTNSARAFASLKKAFPSWEAVVEAGPGRVEPVIRAGGLARNKSRSIVAALEALAASSRGLSLDHLDELEIEEALDELTELPGVGHKTACCVLLFAFDRPAMAVDTHVHRLARRLGLVVERATAEQTFRVLQALTPPELVHAAHVGLVRHGRSTCPARGPRCAECVLADLCPSATS
jgi:endonuclease-3